MKTLLIYSNSDIARDPRVRRQVETLRPAFSLFLATRGSLSGIEGLDMSKLGLGNTSISELFSRSSDIPFPMRIGWLLYKIICRFGWSMALRERLEHALRYRRVEASLHGNHCDAIIANDLDSLPVVFAAFPKVPILFDAHEYYPGQYSGKRAGSEGRYAGYLLRKYLGRCTAVTTVAKGIAKEYALRFGVSEPALVLNAPRFEVLEPSRVMEGKIRLVHHGAAIPQRMMETMIDAVLVLDGRFSLDFYLLQTDAEYYQSLVVRASKDERIRFLPPVAMDDLPKTLNKYDLGLYMLPPLSFNQEHALPNKFFEFIQGRIGVAIGPSPEMKAYVDEYELGLCAGAFTAEAMASALSSLRVEDIERFKRNSHIRARELSAEPQMDVLNNLVARLVADPSPTETT